MIRVPPVVGLAALVIPAFGALALSLAYGLGGFTTSASHPDPVVLYGLAITTLLVDLSAAGLIGALVLSTVVFSADGPEFGRALDIASGSAAILTITAAAAGFLHQRALDPSTLILGSDYGSKLWAFATDSPVGQAWSATTLVAAVLTVVCFAVRSQTVLGFVTIVAMLAFVPVALQAQPGDTPGHDTATGSLYLCIVFAAGWVGGLVTLILSRQQLDGVSSAPVIERYSTIAFCCFLVVAGSGCVNLGLRIGTWSNLATRYGILALVMALGLVALRVFSVLRRRMVARLAEAGAAGRCLWMVVAELVVMGIAEGVAAVLATIPSPHVEVPANRSHSPTPSDLLTGSHLPAAPTPERYLTGLNPDLFWILACAFGLLFYLASIRRLHRQGDRWPIHRTVSWILGLLGLLYVTSGGANVYAKYLFSAQLVAHLVLILVVPVLLVFSAPISLAVRSLVQRDDGSRGAREWMLRAVHSRIIRFLGGPIVAALLLVASLWVVYYTPLFSWVTTDPVGHESTIVYLLFVGCLFVSSLITPGSAPARSSYPGRLLILLVTVVFLAVFGFVLRTGTGLLSANWYGAMGWGPSIPALADQRAAGGIVWIFGGVFALALVGTLLRQRRRSTAMPQTSR